LGNFSELDFFIRIEPLLFPAMMEVEDFLCRDRPTLTPGEKGLELEGCKPRTVGSVEM
jgi:hypothetical protein